MRHLRNRTSLVRWIAAVLLMVFLQGCMHWSVEPLEPKRFNSTDPPHKVRVFLTSGARLEVENPYIVGDSLIWLSVTSGDGSEVPERHGVPVAQIHMVDVRQVDPVATTYGVLALVLAVGSFLFGNWGP